MCQFEFSTCTLERVHFIIYVFSLSLSSSSSSSSLLFSSFFRGKPAFVAFLKFFAKSLLLPCNCQVSLIFFHHFLHMYGASCSISVFFLGMAAVSLKAPQFLTGIGHSFLKGCPLDPFFFFFFFLSFFYAPALSAHPWSCTSKVYSIIMCFSWRLIKIFYCWITIRLFISPLGGPGHGPPGKFWKSGAFICIVM